MDNYEIEDCVTQTKKGAKHYSKEKQKPNDH